MINIAYFIRFSLMKKLMELTNLWDLSTGASYSASRFYSQSSKWFWWVLSTAMNLLSTWKKMAWKLSSTMWWERYIREIKSKPELKPSTLLREDRRPLLSMKLFLILDLEKPHLLEWSCQQCSNSQASMLSFFTEATFSKKSCLVEAILSSHWSA